MGGVKDVDQDTYITAETSAGADNDQLKFYTAGSERMVINAEGDLSLNSDVAIAGNLVMDGTLQVRESQSIINTTINNYEVIVTNDLSLNGKFLASGDVSLNSKLYVKDQATFD